MLGYLFLFQDDLHVHYMGVELILPPIGPPFVQKNLDGAPETDPSCNLQPVTEQGTQKARHRCGPTEEGGQQETPCQKDNAHLQGLDSLPAQGDLRMVIVPDLALAVALHCSP